MAVGEFGDAFDAVVYFILFGSTHVVKVDLFLAQGGKLRASGLHVECGRRHGFLD